MPGVSGSKNSENFLQHCKEKVSGRIIVKTGGLYIGMDEKNWEKEWEGLEPEQPRSGRCGCWLAALLLLIILSAACIGTGYYAWRQLDFPLEPGAILSPPTIAPLASAPAVEGEIIGTPENNFDATRPSLAPTVTLPGSATELGIIEEADAAVTAQSVNQPVQIDGGLNEWAEFPTYQSAFRVFNSEDWDQSDDVRAIWRLGWDQNNFYITVQVEDDIHVQTQSGSTIFKGDGVSLQIDTELDADLGPSLSPDDFQINLSPGDFANNPPAAYRFRGDTSGNLIDMVGHNIQIASRPSGNGYTLEAAIPWRDIGVSPTPGLRMGIALNVNDNDTPGTAVQEVMMSHVTTRKFNDPSSWGLLILK
jgi:hypothetical protein